MSCKSFTLFTKLPPEIRAQIWELSVPFLDTCLVPCCSNCICDRHGYPDLLVDYVNNRHLFGRTLVIVSTMLVNHEAYHCLLELLRRTRNSDDQPLTTTFQPAFDVKLSGLRADVTYISEECFPDEVYASERQDIVVSALALSIGFFYDRELSVLCDLRYMVGTTLFTILNSLHDSVDQMQHEDRWMYKPLTSHFIWNPGGSTFDFIRGDSDECTKHEQAYAAMQHVLCRQWAHDSWEGPREIRPALAIRHRNYWGNPSSKYHDGRLIYASHTYPSPARVPGVFTSTYRAL